MSVTTNSTYNNIRNKHHQNSNYKTRQQYFYLEVYVMWRFFQVWYKDMQSTQREKKTAMYLQFTKNHFSVKIALIKYDLHNKINM